MTEDELRRRARLGEDSYTEFKERIDHPESIAGEIVAFANTEGGRLFVGVSDDGRIVGVPDATQTIDPPEPRSAATAFSPPFCLSSS